MSSLVPLVVEELQSLKSNYAPNELSYLALTQKVEHTIRDSLAFSLHRALTKAGTKHHICREWKRVDLAVLDDEGPKLLLEAKAIYSFDVIKSGAKHQFDVMIQHDMRKSLASKRRTTKTEDVCLLLATHPHSVPAERHKEAVKYLPGIRKHAANELEVGEILKRGADRVVAHSAEVGCIPLECVAAGEIAAGRAFDVSVSVLFWLFSRQLTSELSDYRK